jgi:hypothetical protein
LQTRKSQNEIIFCKNLPNLAIDRYNLGMRDLFKICSVCGRKMQWRAKWATNWQNLKYCSEQCRKNKNYSASDFEAKILGLLQSRPITATICPSEVLPKKLKQDKAQMELVRQAARRLVEKKQLQILQKGKVVDPSNFKGPIRLKLLREKG